MFRRPLRRRPAPCRCHSPLVRLRRSSPRRWPRLLSGCDTIRSSPSPAWCRSLSAHRISLSFRQTSPRRTAPSVKLTDRLTRSITLSSPCYRPLRRCQLRRRRRRPSEDVVRIRSSPRPLPPLESLTNLRLSSSLFHPPRHRRPAVVMIKVARRRRAATLRERTTLTISSNSPLAHRQPRSLRRFLAEVDVKISVAVRHRRWERPRARTPLRIRLRHQRCCRSSSTRHLSEADVTIKSSRLPATRRPPRADDQITISLLVPLRQRRLRCRLFLNDVTITIFHPLQKGLAHASLWLRISLYFRYFRRLPSPTDVRIRTFPHHRRQSTASPPASPPLTIKISLLRRQQ